MVEYGRLLGESSEKECGTIARFSGGEKTKMQMTTV